MRSTGVQNLQISYSPFMSPIFLGDAVNYKSTTQIVKLLPALHNTLLTNASGRVELNTPGSLRQGVRIWNFEEKHTQKKNKKKHKKNLSAVF